jgi:branched-chain amino acid aminotransferase
MIVEFAVRPARRTPDSERKELLADPGFGNVFTDHMVTIRWSAEAGWHDAELGPYGELTLDPAAQVFHYGQEVFEGLKAHRLADGRIVAFRPEANAERLDRSCDRMAMPRLPAGAFVESLRTLVDADREWVPSQEGHSLYLRPFMIATQRTLGFHGRSSEYLFVVIASPSGAYWGAGASVSVWVASDHVRAAPGGTGAAKCGGNYAGTIVEQERAVENGCAQAVWTDAKERRWVEEMGTSNIFFAYGSRLVTPPLTGTMIAGVNRDSLLTLAPDLGYEVEERPVSVEQWRDDARSGALTETFTSGTSAMITPVGRAKNADEEWVVGDGTPGPVALRLREELSGIQLGRRPDPYGWVRTLVP